VIVLAAAALVLALCWHKLLTPEQKLRFGLTFEAARDLQSAAQHSNGDKAALSRYVNALVQEGNLGRAVYLMDLYGAQYSGPGAAGLGDLRKGIAEAQHQLLFRRPYELHKLPAAQAFKQARAPLYQALLYLDGYHDGQLGDWASAKNMLSAIDEDKLALPLRPYYRYYLLRAYRLAGSADEKKKIEPLFHKIHHSAAPRAIKSRAFYNMVAWELGQPNGESVAKQLMADIHADKPDERWAYQKAKTEFANRAWAGGDVWQTWELGSDALLAAPDDRVAQAAGQLMVVAARAQLTGKLPSGETANLGNGGIFNLKMRPGLLTGWARNAVQNGYGGDVKALLKQFVGKVKAEDEPDLLQARATLAAANGEVDTLNSLIASPQFNAAPVETRAEVRFLLAELLRAKQQWNAALAQYRAVSEMNSAHCAESLYERYAILKEVQEPLNLGEAVPLLEAALDLGKKDKQSSICVKCTEELIPLLINAGRKQDAQTLAEEAQDGKLCEPADSDTSKPELVALGQFWLHRYELESVIKTAVKPTVWSYYELQMADMAKPLVPEQTLPDIEDESADEYLAGLGLAQEDGSRSSQTTPVIAYNTIRLHQDWYDQPRQQWSATQMLEAGSPKINEGPLALYLLSQAYPTPYEDTVEAAAKASAVDPALIYAMMKKESNFKPSSVSGPGATGLMQLMPGTAAMLAKGRGLLGAPLTDPKVNIPLGAAYLASLKNDVAAVAAPPGPGEDQHDALLRAVIHCYNGGPGNYAKWRKLYPDADATLLTDLIPNEENEGYAKLVWKYYKIYQWRLKSE